MPIPDWLDAPTTSCMHPGGIRSIQSPADPYVERWEGEPDLGLQLFLARRALRVDPGCIEAHLLLAQHAEHAHEVMAHLDKAVETGSHLWSPQAARDPDLSWWWDNGTRPYMRALAAKADFWAECGDRWSADAIRSQLLAMCPHDPMGILIKVQAEVDDMMPDNEGQTPAPRM